MSSRVFQGVVLQMKESTNRAVGVIDSEGTVVACSDLTCIGERWPEVPGAIHAAENGPARFEGKTFRTDIGLRAIR